MKKKLIALLLATATIVSACGAEAEEPDEEDVETIDEEESPKSDEAEDEDDDEEGDGDGLFGVGEVATTDTNVTAAAETQAAPEAVGDTGGSQELMASEDVSVTIEQSDINSNLWVITNTSTTTYHIQPNSFAQNGRCWVADSCFAPGEVLYYFSASDDEEVTKDTFEFYEETYYQIGSDYDTQCGIVTVKFDQSKYDDSDVQSQGVAHYALDDVVEAYKKQIVYENPDEVCELSYVIYFRLFDADGNVVYEPADYKEFKEAVMADYAFLYEGLYLDPTYLSNWDHAEFYVKTQY